MIFPVSSTQQVWNLQLSQQLDTPAICTVHYGSVSCDADRLGYYFLGGHCSQGLA